jgi:hypothetical protein
MGHDLVALLIFVGVLAVLFLGRKRLGAFVSVSTFFVAAIVYLKAGFAPALPQSAFAIYMSLLLASVLIYVTSSQAISSEVWAPMRRTMVEPRRLPVLLFALLAIPAAVAWRTHAAALPSAVPPPKIRSVHPSPPGTVSFTAPGATETVTIDVINGSNPLRKLSSEQQAEKVAHGNTLSGDGHLVSGVKPPPPATFQDRTVIPNFSETFFFWRISKGGPGLPDEATPFDSTMPQWEKFLTEDDIWSVILFLQDYTNYQFRAPGGSAKAEGK